MLRTCEYVNDIDGDPKHAFFPLSIHLRATELVYLFSEMRSRNSVASF